MNIILPAPPELDGSAQDAKTLTRWCGELTARLKQILYRLDGENISALPPDRLGRGSINTNEVGLSGMYTGLSGTEFSVISPDGKQYIRFEGGNLSIAAKSVTTV